MTEWFIHPSCFSLGTRAHQWTTVWRTRVSDRHRGCNVPKILFARPISFLKTSWIKARGDRLAEPSKSTPGFENIRTKNPTLALQPSPQSHASQTLERALPDYCWRTSPLETTLEREECSASLSYPTTLCLVHMFKKNKKNPTPPGIIIKMEATNVAIISAQRSQLAH